MAGVTLPAGPKRPLTREEAVRRLAQTVLDEYARTGHLPDFIASQIGRSNVARADIRNYPEYVDKIVDGCQRLVQAKDRSGTNSVPREALTA